MDPLKVDKDIIVGTPLVEIGIDSLLAVEIRGWFMKTLEVNIPVLKILSGVPIHDLILMASETISERLVPGFAGVQEEVTKHDEIVEPRLQIPIIHEPDAETPPTKNYEKVHTASSEADSEDTLVPSIRSPSPVYHKTARLSFSQEMFWFIWVFLKDRTSLNHTAWARVSGTVSIPDLERAVQATGQQHEILRTCIVEKHGKPVQSIMSTSNLHLERRTIEAEEEVRGWVNFLQDQHVYDVKQGQTVRIMLLSKSSCEHFFVAGLHPLIADGLSFQSLLKSVQQVYAARQSSSPSSTISHVKQYLDYSEKQHVDLALGAMDGDLRFWKDEFALLPPPLPILTFSSLTTRPDLVVYQNIRARFEVSSETKTKLHVLCRRHRITPFHFYLATFRALLLRYSPSGDGEDVVIGIGDGNRLQDEMVDVIGPFVNFLPLRLQAEGSTKFTDLLQHTRDKVYSALAHSKVPFNVLLDRLGVPRSSAYTSLFQCFVNYRQGMRKLTSWNSSDGKKADLHTINIGLPKVAYDVTLEMVDYADGECTQEIVMRGDIYSQAEVNRLAESYEQLINSFIENSALPLNSPDMLKEEEIIEVMKFTRGPSWESQWPETVVHQIDNIASMEPQATAIWCGDTSTSYAELNNHVNAIAFSLSDASVSVESTVAVMMEPNASFIASLLGVQRAGAVYLPLELSWPLPRLASVVADCQPIVLLVDEDSLSFVAHLQQPGMRVINVSRVDRSIESTPILAKSQSPAALLYTSGSSGTPKGILVKHEGLRNWTEHATKTYDVGKNVVALQQTTPTFDISLIQIFTALCLGGSLCLIPRQQRGDAQIISKVITEREVTLTCATPSEYAAWLHFGDPDLLSNSTAWRTALSIGEPLPPSLMEQIKSAGLIHLSFYNLYGPTEASLSATGMLVPTGMHTGPIAAGSPLPNYAVFVLDQQLRQVPTGMQGEIYIAGAGVGLGYRNRPEQTARMFVPNVFATAEDREIGWNTMHRTGDLGRWREDGMLLMEGRIDTQVKIRGLRIDLSEVEHAIMDVSQGAVREVVVTPRELPSAQSTILVAHIVFDVEADIPSMTLTVRSKLSERLPQYMCPAIVVSIDRLPRTSAAKLDRRSLANLPLEPTDLVGIQPADSDQSALTNTESRQREIWTDLVGLKCKIAASTDFFHIGGSSILLLGLQKRVLEVFGVQMPLVAMFRSSTLRSMADWVDGARDTVEDQQIDWQEETSLPSTLLEFRPAINSSKPTDVTTGLALVLTGATGKLGRAILDNVLADSRIQHVHCIGVRNAQKRKESLMPALGNRTVKVTFHEGNLVMPRLGLSEEKASAIFATANVVIHNGSDMSYLKTYSTLRAVNSQSTKNLAEMCALYGFGRYIPFHYVSTVSVGNVATWTTDDNSRKVDEFVLHPVSVADHVPPQTISYSDMSRTAHGYVASKWASEVFLERLHRQHPNWPVVIHRPSLISREEGDTGGMEFIENMRQYAGLLNAVPVDQTGGHLRVSGAFDVVPLHNVVTGITQSFIQQDNEGLKFLHHLGGEELNLGNFKSWLPEDEEKGKVEEIELGERAKRAVEQGMHPTMESLLMEMSSAKGRLVIPHNSLV